MSEIGETQDDNSSIDNSDTADIGNGGSNGTATGGPVRESPAQSESTNDGHPALPSQRVRQPGKTNDPTITNGRTHGRGYGRMHTIDKRRAIHPDIARLGAEHPDINVLDAEAVANRDRAEAEIDKERRTARGQSDQSAAGKAHHGHALAGILGPAFVAAVAYVDPGNVAANITSGARYGYLLVWVLVLANAMSVLIQYQSAKLGIVTGKSLPELLGERMRDAGRFMFFAQAEVIAIATDLAELIGGAIALNLLFDLPLFVGGCVIGAVSTVLLLFEGGKTHRLFEKIVIALLLVITFGFIAGLFIAPPDPGEVAGGLIPHFTTTDSVLMASSMLGATVMPHAIYLHSTLVNDHYAAGQAKPSTKRLLDGSKVDVVWALLLAGSVNLCLLILAANSLYGMQGTDSIEGAQHAIVSVLGPVIGTIFSIGLLASSLSSTSVGTYAGSEIMHGLLRIKAPMWACRVVTLVPGLIVLWFAPNPTEALVIGQVILSIGIPFAIIPLMRYTHDKALMGKWVDGPVKHALFIAVAVLIIALNVLLVVLTVLGKA